MIHFTYIIVFTCIMYVYTFSLNHNPPSSDFLKVNIVQVITPILQILTLFAIAYFINIKISDKNKKVDLLIEHIDSIIKTIQRLNRETLAYFDINSSTSSGTDKHKEAEFNILHALKELNNKVTFLEKLANNAKLEHYSFTDFQSKNIRILKQEITSNHFKQTTNYPKKQQIKIENLFIELLNYYTLEKLSLYK